MGDDMKDKLRELISTQDQRVLHDPNKFTSLMLDLCLGTNEREIKILATALTEKIPQHLQSSGSKSLTEELRSTLSHRLEIDCALQADAANWAVNTWAEALGMVTVEYSEIKNTDLPDKCDLRSPGKLAMPRPVYPIRAVLFSVIGVVVLGIVIIGGINFFGKSGAGNNSPSVLSPVPLDNKPAASSVPDGNIAYIYKTSHKEEGNTYSTLTCDLRVMDAVGGDWKVLAKDPIGDLSWSPDGERIAFTINDDTKQGFSSMSVYVIDSEGSNLIKLTDTAKDPVWSPDGKKIAIYSLGSGICIIRPDGGKITKLGEYGGRDVSWFPDGSKILFVGGTAGNEIFMMNDDGSKKISMISTQPYEFAFGSPSYSPDGKRIAFLKYGKNSNHELYIMSADGSNQKLVANQSEKPVRAKWSPSGSKIAVGCSDASFILMNADGSEKKRVGDPNWGLLFSWSPDGSKVAFVSESGGGIESRGGIDIYDINTNETTEFLRVDSPSDSVSEIAWSHGQVKDNNIVSSPTKANIAFMSRRDGKYQIYTMNADGTDQKRLTDNTFDAGLPSWSPDGRRIAFRSGQYKASVGFDSPGGKVYSIDADGKNLVLVAGGIVSGVGAPTWSPDGTKMALSDKFLGNLCVVSVDGSDGKTIIVEEGIVGAMWSPSGKMIIYQNWSTSGKMKNGIWSINTDGSDKTLLCENGYLYRSSSGWSPDGKKICFGSTKDGNFEIHVMDTDGSNQRRLTNNVQDDYDPSWSPNSKMIAFSSMRDGNYQIYAMNADGSNQRRLTNNSFDDYNPSWSPDGTLITFSSKREGNSQIYVMNSNGTNQTQLTKGAGDNEYPVWSPQ